MNKFSTARFNLYTIIRDTLYNWWVIILALITGFVGSVCYFNFIYKHHYESSMTISINLSGYTNEATALSLARTIEITEKLDDVFQSNAMKDVVTKAIGRPITANISASQIPETNLVVVTSTDVSPENAYETLLAVHNNYTKVTDYVFSNVIIRTIVNPTMPNTSSRLMTSLKMGVIIGMLFAIGVTAIIVLISFLRDTVKGPDDVERELDTKLFGVINHIKGQGANIPSAKRPMVINNTFVGSGFAKIAVKIESLRRTKNAKVFMLTSVTENEGKTSCSVNTALALTQNGHKVLLIDCDLKRPSVQYFFNQNKEDFEGMNLSDFLINGGDINRYLKRDEKSGLYILGNINGVKGSAELVASERFSQLVSTVKDVFDYIIVDTPPYGMVADAEIISELVDATILVVRQDVVSIKDINDVIHNLEKTYLAGCILNDVSSFSKNAEYQNGYNNYFGHHSL